MKVKCWSIEKIKEILMKVTPEVVEKNFPKGQCKERGQAIVLHAEMLLAMTQALVNREASVWVVDVYPSRVLLVRSNDLNMPMTFESVIAMKG